MSTPESTLVRECGTCTACCVTLRIDEFTPPKPADTACQHCELNVGCKVYSARPHPICSTFECFWLSEGNLGMGLLADDQRPDQSGLIVTGPGGLCEARMFNMPVLVAHETFPGAAGTYRGQKILSKLGRRAIIIVASRDAYSQQVVVAPNQETVDLMQDWLRERVREAYRPVQFNEPEPTEPTEEAT